MTPFYKKALQLFAKTQSAQIEKGLKKYPEPFNPMSWTPEELLNHALEESVDLVHYLVGLKELLDAKSDEIELLKFENKRLVKQNSRLSFELWKEETKDRPVRNLAKEGKLPQKSPFEEQYDMNFNPHFDQDDQ
jgi:hypothetical protein